MVSAWILFLSFYKISLLQAMDPLQPSFVSAKRGEAVTLTCTFPIGSVKVLVLYKQRLGKIPQLLGTWLKQMDVKMSVDFPSSRFKLETITTGISLTIERTEERDEAVYLCATSIGSDTKLTFSSRTFLSVTGHHYPSVDQSSLVQRVPPGESVSLQCSVFSERTTPELRVLWFRAAAGDSHPEIIYTHHNSSHQCEISSSPHSCVYKLSKRVLSLSDTGTYYCAVATCGKILLGNGTTVDLTWPVDPIVLSLAAAVGVCLIVIAVQAVLNHRNWKQFATRLEEGMCESTTDQEHGAMELSYAAIDLSKRQTTENRGRQNDSLYSEVKCPDVSESLAAIMDVSKV